MVTVMRWGNSDGTKGRCDAKCHKASAPNCSCMCNGRYHGAGREPGGMRSAMERYARERAQAEGMELKAKTLAELLQLEQLRLF